MVKRTKTEPEPTTTLAIRGAEALAVADGFDANDHRGKENITQDSITVPRLALAQKTSPQLEPGKPEYMEDLKLFQMFNTMTGEIYGAGPLAFAIVSYDERAIEFDATNKVVDFNVPLNDKRLLFPKNPDGTPVKNQDGTNKKPQATLFNNFLVLLVKSEFEGELVQLAMKGTQIKTAKRLNGFQTIRNGPAWGGIYELRSVSRPSGAFTVGGFEVKPIGPTPPAIVMQADVIYTLLLAGKVKVQEPTNEAETVDSNVPF